MRHETYYSDINEERIQSEIEKIYKELPPLVTPIGRGLFKFNFPNSNIIVNSAMAKQIIENLEKGLYEER